MPTESVAENRHDPTGWPAARLAGCPTPRPTGWPAARLPGWRAARLSGCPGEAIQADQALVVYRRLEYDSSAPIAEFSAQQMFI